MGLQIKCLSVQFEKRKDAKAEGVCNLFPADAQKAIDTKNAKSKYFFYDRDCQVGQSRQCGVYSDGSAFYKTTTVNGVQQCISTCKNDIKCQSSEYKPSNGKCWLYGKPVSEAKTKDDTKGTWIFNDKDCPVPQCGVYGDGSDFYKVTEVDSVQKCITTCNSDSKCQSSEFKPSNGKCWLYAKTVAEAKTKDNEDGTWIFNDRSCPAPQCGVFGDGSDYYTSSTVKSEKDCILTCHKDSKCMSSEYKPSNGKCWLYQKSVAQAKTKDDTKGTWIFNDRGCAAKK